MKQMTNEQLKKVILEKNKEIDELREQIKQKEKDDRNRRINDRFDPDSILGKIIIEKEKEIDELKKDLELERAFSNHFRRESS